MSAEPTMLPSEPSEIERYRAISALAIVSLLCALLSPVALAHPAAWFIPVVAAVLAVVAIVRIQRRPEALLGRKIALAALLLSTFFATCAPAWYYGERWLLYREARGYAEEWLTAVLSGDLNKSHQGCLAMRKRQPLGTLLDEYYAQNESIRIDRDNQFATGAWHRLTEFKQGTTFHFIRNHNLYYADDDCVINQRFLIQEPGTAKSFRLQIEIVRYANQNGVFMRIIGVADADQIDARQRRS